MNQRDRLLLYAVIITIGFCACYLTYAAFRGWVGLDILTLLVSITNTCLLIFLLRRLHLTGRDV